MIVGKCKVSSWTGGKIKESLSIVSNFFIYLYCEHIKCHRRKALDTIKNSSFVSIDAQECVVPENIHTPPTEGHGNSKG